MRLIEEFKAGDEIPEFVLSAEPNTAGSERPRIYFKVDCFVLEHPEGYMLIARELSGDSIVGVDDGTDYTISAPSRPVIIPFRFQMVEMAEDRDGLERP